MLTSIALEQLHVDATKRVARSSEQHHHTDQSAAPCCWEKQPACAQQLGMQWRRNAAMLQVTGVRMRGVRAVMSIPQLLGCSASETCPVAVMM